MQQLEKLINEARQYDTVTGISSRNIPRSKGWGAVAIEALHKLMARQPPQMNYKIDFTADTVHICGADPDKSYADSEPIDYELKRNDWWE